MAEISLPVNWAAEFTIVALSASQVTFDWYVWDHNTIRYQGRGQCNIVEPSVIRDDIYSYVIMQALKIEAAMTFKDAVKLDVNTTYNVTPMRGDTETTNVIGEVI